MRNTCLCCCWVLLLWALQTAVPRSVLCQQQPAAKPLDQQFNSWRLTPAQAAAIGHPAAVGRVRICFSPYTPYVFCDPSKPADTYSGYLLEVFRSLAQEVSWLSDFGALFFDCLEWTAMLRDLASDNGTCLMAPADVSPAEAAQYPNIRISWILEKEGLKILIVPRQNNANLWYPLTVFSPPVWAMLLVTSTVVGFVVWVVDTNARNLLADTEDTRRGLTARADTRRPARRGVARSFMKTRAAAMAGRMRVLQAQDTANGAAHHQKLPQHSTLGADTTACRGDVELGPPRLNSGSSLQQAFVFEAALEPAAGSRSSRHVAQGWARCSSAAVRWLGVRRGDEAAATKSLRSNIINAMMYLASIGSPPVARTLPGRVILFAYGLLLLILLAIYTATSAAQLTVRMASDIRSLQDLKGKPVATWEAYAPRLLAMGVPAVSLKWETDKDEQAMLDMVRSGQTRALVINRAFVDYVASHNCEFAVVGDEFGMTDYGIAFNSRMQDDLIQDLNRHIAAFIQQGSSEQLYDLHIKRPTGNCERSLAADAHTVTQVSLYQVAALWVMLALSMGISCCVLLAYWLRLHLGRVQQVATRHLSRMSECHSIAQQPKVVSSQRAFQRTADSQRSGSGQPTESH